MQFELKGMWQSGRGVTEIDLDLSPAVTMAASSHSPAGPSSPSPLFLGEGTSVAPLPPPPPIPFRKPGRSILKQPPPPQPKFFSFSTFSKLLPNQSPQFQGPVGPPDDGGKGIRGTPLKRAHFILPSLSTTYPIWSNNPPASPSLEQEKADIEQRERTRRARLVRGNSVSSLRSTSLSNLSTSDDFWSLEKVEQFYKECCLGREEPIDLRVLAAIKVCMQTSGVIMLTPPSGCRRGA